MKIALIGPTGFIGKAVLEEALARGHDVTAIARDPVRVSVPVALRERLTIVEGDVNDVGGLVTHLDGQEVLVSAFSGHAFEGQEVYDQYLRGFRNIVEAAGKAKVRLFSVGGAGSLFVAPGVQLVDTAEFPAAWKETALGARDALALLQKENDALDWTVISPSPMLEPGPRTGQFRLGGDEVLMQGDAPSSISVADLAVAILDEVEAPQHRRARFTAGY